MPRSAPMDSRETLVFARALMNEVWLPLDPEPVPRVAMIPLNA